MQTIATAHHPNGATIKFVHVTNDVMQVHWSTGHLHYTPRIALNGLLQTVQSIGGRITDGNGETVDEINFPYNGTGWGYSDVEQWAKKQKGRRQKRVM